MTAGSPSRARERLVALVAVLGGVAIATGAFLPWLSLDAGLHPLRGVVGLYGRLMAAGGVVCLMAGVRQWLRPAVGVRRIVTVLGWVVAAFATWLTVQLIVSYHQLRANPMLVPRLGPGLFVVLAGSLVVGTTAAMLGREDSNLQPSG